ncbi:metal-dependent hydrolase [Rhodohalobacter sulfatireducens]|uniref:Metal-dependent hydrolase n=1 Tax=Rhodohalobacter sulfatireducens TaxID=2911366 RepID=A0ABS9KCR0_9BACT|nr:metal-dependent hydrolase [Rhodohalobacter sulfatireducens]MCG2588640.1 metal-dependent hydrolase [Rhodohalobacter sulfatireducens]
MDPITHGFIGATASQTVAKPETFRAATFTGFVSAMLADLDVFIPTGSDPLMMLELHRHFTHSIIFIPIGALIATCLTWWFVKKYLTKKEAYLYSFAGYSTAGVFDFITSYGVYLFWPFLDERYSLNIISVFDPLFTLGIILLTGIAFFKKKVYVILAGGWLFLYLSFGYMQQQRAEEAALQLASYKGHDVGRMVLKPTIANQLLWSVRYEADGNLYAAGIRLIPFFEPTIYDGEQAPLLEWEERFSAYEGTTLYRDIRRFSALSDDFLIMHPEQENVIGDGRYSMLPTTLSPLWGIEVDTTNMDQHVTFDAYRDAGSENRQAFLNMLLGRNDGNK